MPSKIKYEWLALELDSDGDIENISFHSSFLDAMKESIDTNTFFKDGSVELVKYYMDGHDIDGDTRTAWNSHTLDIGDEFDDGSKIPQYLRKQVQNSGLKKRTNNNSSINGKKMRTNRQHCPLCIENPRPIPIDKNEINKIVSILIAKIYKYCFDLENSEFYETPLIDISSAPILLSSYLIDVPMVGTSIVRTVKIQVYSSNETYSLSPKYISGGAFGLKNDNYGILSIFINARFSPKNLVDIIAIGSSFKEEFYLVFIHEYTHARQYRKPIRQYELELDRLLEQGEPKNYKGRYRKKVAELEELLGRGKPITSSMVLDSDGMETYVNLKDEVGAFNQQIVDEVLSKYQTKKSMINFWFNNYNIQDALKLLSPEYKRLLPYLNEDNNFYILNSVVSALQNEGFQFKRKSKLKIMRNNKCSINGKKMRTNRQKPIADPQDRFKRWHWGIPSTNVIDVQDKRFPDEMIEIGRLMEMRLVRPIEIRSNSGNKEKLETMSLEIDEDSMNECHVVFDNNHSKDRIYFLLNSKTQSDLKKIYSDLDEKPQLLNELAIYGGGHHGKMNDYPKVKVKPLGYVSDLVYYTHKKGDDDGIGSGYTHEMGEEGGVQPLLGVAEDGTLWLIGGSYTCPYAGITN